ncbi:hypothetical protein K492DRAFT_179909 [Lichtheimia hyalospora FSU 10163]|nr:hypothetical protein K492DRAFT_179909 [Lichtheimia hyalospora FSU 10163]
MISGHKAQLCIRIAIKCVQTAHLQLFVFYHHFTISMKLIGLFGTFLMIVPVLAATPATSTSNTCDIKNLRKSIVKNAKTNLVPLRKAISRHQLPRHRKSVRATHLLELTAASLTTAHF